MTDIEQMKGTWEILSMDGEMAVLGEVPRSHYEELS